MTSLKKYIISLFVLFVGVCFGMNAQSPYNLTVQELFEKGIQNSIAVQSSYLKKQIAEDKIVLAKNKRIADIQATGQFGYVGTPTILDKDLSFLKHSNTPDWKQFYQVNAVQPLYQGGRIKNNIVRTELEKTIAELSVDKTKSDLKLWLIGKYLDLYNLYRRRDIYTINIKEAERRLRDIEKMKEQGMITSNDVLRSRLLLTDYELSYKETANNISLTSQQLAIALGMDEDIIYSPDSLFLENSMNISGMTDYVQSAYQNYPDMRITNTNIDLAKNNLKITNADYLPALSLQVGNTFQRPIPNVSPAQDLYMNAWGITLNLSYRISALFDRKHSLSAARTQINLQELAQEQQKQDIRMKVKSAYLKHQEAEDRVKSLEESVEQANENYRIVSKKYFNQLAILTDLLDANAVQLTAELQLTAAKANAMYTYYQLLNISGKL